MATSESILLFVTLLMGWRLVTVLTSPSISIQFTTASQLNQKSCSNLATRRFVDQHNPSRASEPRQPSFLLDLLFGCRLRSTNRAKRIPGHTNCRRKFIDGSRADNTCQQLPAHMITDHFQKWLRDNGFGQYDFATNGCGEGESFGGRLNANDFRNRMRPIIFIHGVTGSALGGGMMGDCGWSSVINSFMQHGYKMADLYALSWGPNDPLSFVQVAHDFVYLQRVNKFIQAVLAYTGAAKVDVIAHSMGATLTRGAIAGVNQCGPNLSDRVETFISIAGPNHGFPLCELFTFTHICNEETGLDPRSQYFNTINYASGVNVASKIFSICSSDDELIDLAGCMMPGQKCGFQETGPNHHDVAAASFQQQLTLIQTGRCQL